MTTTNLCKCNNCDNVLIDQNPQVNAPEFELNGTELEMTYEESQDGGCFWACPICLTDDYLTDEIGRKTLDCTPTWERMLPGMLDLYDQPNASFGNKQVLKEEFRKMAIAADLWNKIQN